MNGMQIDVAKILGPAFPESSKAFCSYNHGSRAILTFQVFLPDVQPFVDISDNHPWCIMTIDKVFPARVLQLNQFKIILNTLACNPWQNDASMA